MRLRRSLISALVATLVIVGGATGAAITIRAAHAAPSPCAGSVGATAMTGSLGGAKYKIEVPANWNGTLLLYSHGYQFTAPATVGDVGDPITGGALLHQGFALAGSGYSRTGWALQQAFHDQIALLDFFNATCGHPAQTIAWGHSLGGIITAGLVQLNPGRFAGALPMCGVVGGGVGAWNQGLDSSFAFSQLLTGGALPIVHLNPAQLGANFGQAEGVLQQAQGTAAGRARIALAAALADIPGWFDPFSPEPASTDIDAQELAQFQWQANVDLAFAFFGRAELEFRAGGNPSWNTGVDYHAQLAHSADRAEVMALYAAAGLDLNADLDALNAAPRIAGDPGAVAYLSQFIIFNGDLGGTPVLTMHTTGDGLVQNEHEQSYRNAVNNAGDPQLLRQIFVHRAGHCTFTPAETLTALSTLLRRVGTGKWSGTDDPDGLNEAAAALGPTFNVFSNGGPLVATPPAFVDFSPTKFLRPFTTFTAAGD
jgi:pimeloyl-ACP methyl ester carboxylesterase